MHQEGVISAPRCLACGGTDSDIARMVRRRKWKVVHPGVYVDHTARSPRSRPSGRRCSTARRLPWAGDPLFAATASGQGATVRRRVEHTDVHVVVERHRRIHPPSGIEVTRLKRFDEDVRANFSPPRLCLEQAVVEVASAQVNEAGAVAILCDAVQSRRTTPQRLLAALTVRPRLRHRSLLRQILADVALSGAYSVLERKYLLEVERPHGFPHGARQRQVRSGPAPAYRDVVYPGRNTVVELDGTLGHERALDRWKDLDRDVASAVWRGRHGQARVGSGPRTV